MAFKMGFGYGSEWHLMRFMGRYRNRFNKEIINTIGYGDSIEWLDFIDIGDKDKEVEGLDFLCPTTHEKVIAKWLKKWPQRGAVPSWDAVGWLNSQGRREVILIEAKAHPSELITSRRAKLKRSKAKIAKFLNGSKKALGAETSNKWLKKHYQYANRLGILNFLHENDIQAHLIYIYFCGDAPPNKKCPQNREEWIPYIEKKEAYLGIQNGHALSKRVHEIFLQV